ncbi:MAG: hypothetical protein RRY23_06835 [Alistipes sp.]
MPDFDARFRVSVKVATAGHEGVLLLCFCGKIGDLLRIVIVIKHFDTGCPMLQQLLYHMFTPFQIKKLF